MPETNSGILSAAIFQAGQRYGYLARIKLAALTASSEAAIFLSLLGDIILTRICHRMGFKPNLPDHMHSRRFILPFFTDQIVLYSSPHSILPL